MNEPWTGAWRFVTSGADGRPTATTTRYCYMSVQKDRTPKAEPLSDSDAADLVRSVNGAGGGSFEDVSEGDELLQTHSNFVGFLPKQATSTVLRSAQVSGDDMSQQVLGPDREILADHKFTRITEAGESELAGAWEVSDKAWSGIVIFTDSQYQFLVTRDDRPEDTTKDSPDSDLADLYKSTHSEAGSYLLGDGVLEMTPDIAMNPAKQQVADLRKYALTEGMLELEFNGSTFRFGKVE
jgi:hypothetical protein